MASTGAPGQAHGDPWQAWEEALDQVLLPAQRRVGNIPMPEVLQRILDSFVEFDAGSFGLDLPEGDIGPLAAPTAPESRAGSRRSQAA